MRIFTFKLVKTDSDKEKVFFFLMVFGMFLLLTLASRIWAYRLYGITGILIFLVGAGGKSFSRLWQTLKTFPSEKRKFLYQNSFYYRYLDKRTRRRFERDIKIFLSELKIKRLDESRVEGEEQMLVAMGLATVLLGRPEWELPIPEVIYLLTQEQLAGELKLGEFPQFKHAAAATRNALYLTEENLNSATGESDYGYNNIYHEVAHYFDMEGWRLNGLPSFARLEGTDSQGRGKITMVEWEKTLYTELGRAVTGEFKIRPYALKSIEEFFACVNEYFFEQPEQLKKNSRALYGLLERFYNFDPVEILQQPPRES